MKIGITGNRNSWHFSQLNRAAMAKNIQLIPFAWDHMKVVIDADRCSEFFVGDRPIADFDCILTRTMSPGSLQQIVFRMDLLQQIESQLGIAVINPAKTVEASVDKYLSLEKIRSAGVRVPRTLVSQNLDAAMSHFDRLAGDVVAKPIFGSQGRGIVRLQDTESASQHFENLIATEQIIYQQQFLCHNKDYRLLVIGSEIYAMSRHRPGHWITNASLGATCEFHDPTTEEIAIAKKSAEAVGASIAGVDIVYDEGKPYVVEINSSPAWQAISKVVEVDIADRIISFAEQVGLCRFCSYPDCHELYSATVQRSRRPDPSEFPTGS